MNSNSPLGWVECDLHKLVDILDSSRIPINSDERAERQGSIPYYGATGQVGWIDDYIFDEELLLLGEDGAPFYDKAKPISYIINGKSWVNNHAHVLRAITDITSNKYLKYFFDWFDYHGYVNGTTRLKLTQTSMRNIPVRVAPFNEQKRIVEKLDKIFANMEICEKKLDIIPDILRQFRKSILENAYAGYLTEEWRTVHNEKNEWPKMKLAELSVKVGSGATPRGGQASYKKSGIPLIRSQNIHFEKFVYKGLAYIDSKQAKALDNVKVEQGDVLLNITGASIGRVNQAPSDMEGARVNQHVSIIRTNEKLNPTYLKYFLASPEVQDFIWSENYGVTREALTKQMILDIDISLPPLEEQREIVNIINRLFGIIDEIENRYNKGRNLFNKINQSVLSKAFSGELVHQDPSDEPAEVLLHKIRDIRKKIPQKRRNKRKTAH